MIIESATINMQSAHHFLQSSRYAESFRAIRSEGVESTVRPPANDRLTLSKAVAESRESTLDLDRQPDAMHSLMMQIIRRMVKEITGKELKLFSPADLQGKADEVRFQVPAQAQPNRDSGLVYEQSFSYFESENTSFSAEGSIKTKDGQSIDFSVSLSMSRSFYFESNQSIRLGESAKTDPLVINFDGNAAELSNTFFEFDIDADGKANQIAMLKPGSGLLALDKNQDGVVNDGSELFGPASGNGFEELAAYDEDNNHFIDEADSIYQRLRIWFRHSDGTQQLLALGQKNVGAIYLGHVSTPFQLKAEDTSLGEVATSGIYLSEQGEVGTLQQINFTV